MTGALLERPCSPPAADESVDRGPVTLEELLNGTLEAVRAGGSAECPVCRACMASTRAATEDPVGHCGTCGSRLS